VLASPTIIATGKDLEQQY